MAQSTMKAVVFDGPHKVSVQDRPVPKREFHPDGTWGLLKVKIGSSQGVIDSLRLYPC